MFTVQISYSCTSFSSTSLVTRSIASLQARNQNLALYYRFSMRVITLPKTNIAPENGPSQKETSIPTSGAMLVSRGVSHFKEKGHNNQFLLLIHQEFIPDRLL